ncbi:hypothetical protein TNCV_2989821 [Trichonephila clavipes]|nr:hypothetical protein TNCV_2989821 [Trichonephila clavipes]
MSTFCRARCFSRRCECERYPVGKLVLDCRCRFNMTVWWQAFPWPPSDQHTVITGTKPEPAFIRKHNKSHHHPPRTSGWTLLESQTAIGVSGIHVTELQAWSYH